MATVPKETRRLTFVEIVMNADADVIKAAYEARLEVDKLLALREEAYRQIAGLEIKVEEIMGQQGLFVFPPPPLAVSGLEAALPRPRKKAPPTGSPPTPPPPATEATPAPTPTASEARAATASTPATGTKAAGKAEAPERPPTRSGGTTPRSH